MTQFDPQDVAALAESIAGEVMRPGDPAYEAEIGGFNVLARHQPALVVGAAEPADVQAAIRFAIGHDVPVAIHSTGHQIVGPSDGAVMVSTRRMRTVTVDAAGRTARIEAGARWGDVVKEVAPFGLAALNGSSPLVGVPGFILGGGHSPIMGRTYGWAADHVRAIDVVTANGQLRRATPTDHPDLFWAMRGSKSNFGVATAIEISLFPVTEIYAGGLYFDGRDTAAVLGAYRELTTHAPDELNSSVALLRLPDLPFVPEPLRGKLTVNVRISYLGPEADGERLIKPLRDAAPMIIDAVRVMPYANNAEVHQDPTDPVPYGERDMLLTELTPEGVEAVVAGAGPESGAQFTIFELRHLGGALAREPEAANAVAIRDAGFTVWGLALGDPAHIGTAVGHLDGAMERLREWDLGRRFLNTMHSGDRVEQGYTPETYQRLREIKTAYDPGNIFRVNNHNIPPQAQTS